MTRYQIYLNPNHIATLDQIGSDLKISRSQIIRDVIDRVSHEYEKVLKAVKSISFNNHPLLKMSGMFKGVKGSIAENDDEMYLKD